MTYDPPYEGDEEEEKEEKEEGIWLIFTICFGIPWVAVMVLVVAFCK